MTPPISPRPTPEKINGTSGIACTCQFPEPQRLVLTGQMICTGCGHRLFSTVKREAA